MLEDCEGSEDRGRRTEDLPLISNRHLLFGFLVFLSFLVVSITEDLPLISYGHRMFGFLGFLSFGSLVSRLSRYLIFFSTKDPAPDLF